MSQILQGRDDLHLRSEGLDGQLKAHLVVALAGAAVGDGVRAFGQSDFTIRLAMIGRAKEVPSRYLFSYTAPALRVGQM